MVNVTKLKKVNIVLLFMIVSNVLLGQCDSTKLCYYNRDTLAYFKNVFEYQKNSFINHSLEYLINKFEAKPIEYYYKPLYKNKDSCRSLDIYFAHGFSYNRKTKTSIMLEVSFKNLILEDSCVYQGKIDRGFWLHSTRQFYGNRIIKDFKFIEVQY